MSTATKDEVAKIREALDALALALSSDHDEVVDRLPEGCGDEWDALLDAVADAEGSR